jgi:uncharacterized protein
VRENTFGSIVQRFQAQEGLSEMLKAIGSKKNLESDECAFYRLIADLLDSDVVREMENYVHHGNTTCFQHCLNVSYYNYKLCKFFSLNERAGARAGMLHDLFLYDWHTYERPKGERLHGFTHAKRALKNVKKNFYVSDLESDIIEKHMFPLNLFSVPKYRETLVIVFTDKLCGIMEVLSYKKSVVDSAVKRTFHKAKEI